MYIVQWLSGSNFSYKYIKSNITHDFSSMKFTCNCWKFWEKPPTLFKGGVWINEKRAKGKALFEGRVDYSIILGSKNTGDLCLWSNLHEFHCEIILPWEKILLKLKMTDLLWQCDHLGCFHTWAPSRYSGSSSSSQCTLPCSPASVGSPSTRSEYHRTVN